MRPKATPADLLIALGMTLLGGLCLYLALRRGFSPRDMAPGVEGALGAGVLGSTLAVLEPLEFRRAALFFSAPLAVVETVVTRYVEGPALGVLALHLIIVGFIGLALGLREPVTTEGDPPCPPARPAEGEAAERDS